MILSLTICLVVCLAVACVATYMCIVLWKKYWSLAENISDITARIVQHNDAIKKLMKREILSNDQTVISFVKHIGAIVALFDVFSKLNIVETVSDETEEN